MIDTRGIFSILYIKKDHLGFNKNHYPQNKQSNLHDRNKMVNTYIFLANSIEKNIQK